MVKIIGKLKQLFIKNENNFNVKYKSFQNDEDIITQEGIENDIPYIILLPKEILKYLFSILKGNELLNTSRTCKLFWYFIDKFKIWETLFRNLCPIIYSTVQFTPTWSTNKSKMILCLFNNLSIKRLKSIKRSGEKGEIKMIVKLLKIHLKNSNIVIEILYIIKSLCSPKIEDPNFHIDNQKSFLQYYGIRLMVMSMKLHFNVPKLQENACRALGLLALGFRNTTHNIYIINIGGIKPIVSAIKNHSSDYGVLNEAIVAIGNLAGDGSNKYTIHFHGCIQLILNVMKKNLPNVDLQILGSNALKRIAFYVNGVRYISRIGGIKLIVKVMELFPKNSILQNNCCYLLYLFSFKNRYNCNLISSLSGPELLLKSMKNHLNHIGNQINACRSIKELTCNNKNNQIIFADKGAVQLIFKVMKMYPKNIIFQIVCKEALFNLSFRKETKLIIAQTGGIELMDNAIQNHPKFKIYFSHFRKVLQFTKDSIKTKL